MERLTIQPKLKHLIGGAGDYSAEASSLGIMKFPHEIEFDGTVYSEPKALKDAEGETYAVEYLGPEHTFTLWND